METPRRVIDRTPAGSITADRERRVEDSCCGKNAGFRKRAIKIMLQVSQVKKM